MEFGKHIGKGVWAFADKALPAIYGIGFIFLVVRVLPEKEFGAYGVIWATFTFLSTLGYALALQPFVKFAAETDTPGPYIVAALTISGMYFTLVSVLLMALKGFIVPLLDKTHESNLDALFSYLPLLFLTALYRSFGISLLQSRYSVQKIFWVDALYFLGMLALIAASQVYHLFSSAEDLIKINLFIQTACSILAFAFTKDFFGGNFRFVRKAFSDMWGFGKFSLTGVGIYTAYAQMDVFVVSSYVGLTGVAVYNAAKNFTRFFDMTSQVLTMFLIPFSSKNYKEGNIEKLRITAEKSICFSVLLLLPVFLVMLLFPQQLLHILFKGKYDDGASLVRTMSFLALIVPWNAVIASYLNGTGKVKEGLYSSIILLVITIPAYFILTPLLGALGTSIALVSCMLIVTIVLVFYIQRVIPLRVGNVLGRTADVWLFLKKKLSIA
ncbi:MAG TPA: MATE family efflux transporter [Bacteroidota bacterium]|nr:MATE family efflux transporter [Bacteroidota bacterium]